MNIGKMIDDLVAVFNPQAACRRQAYRSIYGAGGYDGANITRKDTIVKPSNAIAENDNAMARAMLRDKARDLEKNSDMVASMIQSITSNVIGSSLNVQSRSQDKEFNKLIEELFAEWCYHENCDISETQSFNEILEMAVTRWIVDGGIMLVTSIDKASKFGLKIQIREVDDIDESEDTFNVKNGNRVVHGIEINQYGKPIRYYLKVHKAGTLENYEVEKIPAKRVHFLWTRKRATQYREVTNLHTSIVSLGDLADFRNALAFQQKAAACTQAFIECDANTMPGRPVNTQDGKRIHDLQAGTITYLKPGEHLKPFIPVGQAAQADAYVISEQRMIAAAMGLSLESATRNVERVNYSSARQNLLADQKTYNKIRAFLYEHLLRPLFAEFVDACYLKGLLRGTKYTPDNEDYYKCMWLSEGTPWIDPKKEAEADAIRLANGGLSFKRYCADRGEDWQERIDDMAEVQEYAKSKGVELNYIVQNESMKQESEDTSNGGNEETGSDT